MTKEEQKELIKKYTSKPLDIFLDARIPYYEASLIKTITENNWKIAVEMKNKKLTFQDLPIYQKQMAQVREFMDIYVLMGQDTVPELNLQAEFSNHLALEVQDYTNVMRRFGDEHKTDLLTYEIYDFVSKYKEEQLT